MHKENLNPRLPCQGSIQQEAGFFHQQIGLKFKEETSKFLRLEFCVVLKLGHFGKRIRNTREVLKCGAGTGWRRPFWTDRVRKEKVLGLHRVKEELNMLQIIKRRKVKCVGHYLRRN
jgi:hypothetical protein